MIKMISCNNFNNFDAKASASTQGNEDLAKDFTAVFNVFSPPQPETEIVPQSVKTTNSDELQSSIENPDQNQVLDEAEPAFEKETDLSFLNVSGEYNFPKVEVKAEVKLENKLEFVNQTNLSDETILKAQNNNILPESVSSLWENPAVIEKVKTDHYKVINTQDNSQEDITILTQFSNKLPKLYGNFDRNQITPSEPESIKIPNLINTQRRQPTAQIDFNQENILDLPENDVSVEAVENKTEYSFQNTENVKIKNVEIISFESSIKQNFAPLKSENSLFSEANVLNYQIKKETISTGKILNEEDSNRLVEKVKTKNSVEANFELADLEIPEIKPKIKTSDTLEFENVSDINEISTDNIETIDLEKAEVTELNVFESPGSVAKTEKIIPKKIDLGIISKPETPIINFEAANPDFEVVKSDFELAKSNLNQRAKIENVEVQPQIIRETLQNENLNQTQKIIADSVPTPKLRYFFNLETNRVEEVKNEIIAANTDVLYVKESTKDSFLSFDTENQIQPTNSLKKLYTKVSDIFQNESVEVEKTVQPQILAAVEKEEKPVENQVQEFSSESLLKNPAQTINPVRHVKTPEILTEEILNERGESLKNESEISQKPQNISPIINPPSNNFTSNQSFQSGQTISQININAVERAIPKPDKPLKFSNEFANLNFGKLLQSVSNQQEIIEVTPNSSVADKAVLEQIEPKIIELATFVEKSEEKHFLKMRLNPAELGEVEIKLEKDASGKIYAQIRTENEPARHILAESLGQLRDSLQNAGWQIERLEVSCNPNQSGGNDNRENQSRQSGNTENGRNNAFNFDGNLENEGETQENPADRLVNLRA